MSTMWPWRRSPLAQPAAQTGTVGSAAQSGGEVLRAPRAEWRALPPIQRAIGEAPLVNPVSRFQGSLSAWQDPSFLAPLAHVVHPDEPSGTIPDLIAAAGPAHPELPLAGPSSSGPLSAGSARPVQRAIASPARQVTVLPEAPTAATVAPGRIEEPPSLTLAPLAASATASPAAATPAVTVARSTIAETPADATAPSPPVVAHTAPLSDTPEAVPTLGSPGTPAVSAAPPPVSDPAPASDSRATAPRRLGLGEPLAGGVPVQRAVTPAPAPLIHPTPAAPARPPVPRLTPIAPPAALPMLHPVQTVRDAAAAGGSPASGSAGTGTLGATDTGHTAPPVPSALSGAGVPALRGVDLPASTSDGITGSPSGIGPPDSTGSGTPPLSTGPGVEIGAPGSVAASASAIVAQTSLVSASGPVRASGPTSSASVGSGSTAPADVAPLTLARLVGDAAPLIPRFDGEESGSPLAGAPTEPAPVPITWATGNPAGDPSPGATAQRAATATRPAVAPGVVLARGAGTSQGAGTAQRAMSSPAFGSDTPALPPHAATSAAPAGIPLSALPIATASWVNPVFQRSAAGGTPASLPPPVTVSREAADPEPPADPPFAPPTDAGPADGGSASASAPAAGGDTAGGGDPEALVAKLFDPLLSRLKTELRLDRERRGSLTDLWH